MPYTLKCTGKINVSEIYKFHLSKAQEFQCLGIMSFKNLQAMESVSIINNF